MRGERSKIGAVAVADVAGFAAPVVVADAADVAPIKLANEVAVELRRRVDADAAVDANDASNAFRNDAEIVRNHQDRRVAVEFGERFVKPFGA